MKRFNSTVYTSLFIFYLPSYLKHKHRLMFDVFVTGIISGLVSITGECHKTIKITNVVLSLVVTDNYLERSSYA